MLELGRKMNLKVKTTSSGTNWPVFWQPGFEALRGRIRENLKHESCSEQFFLEDTQTVFENKAPTASVFMKTRA